jgi:DNA-binding CsgD family transcriptional regulator
VNAKPAGPSKEATGAPTLVSADEVNRLLATFRELRDEGRSLMARLRSSMYEMQAQRSMLRQDREAPANGNGGAPMSAAATRLQQEYGMTRREIEVALLLADGCSNTVVARRLGISPHTARHHTQRVLGKLGVHSRAQAGARIRR